MSVVSPLIGDAICFFVSRLPTCVPPKRNIMNAKSKTWMVGVWALCLCACADNNPSVTNEPSVPVPIGFSSDVASAESPQTRGTVLTAIDKLRLFASYTGTADWDPSSYSFDYMYDQSLEKSGTDGSWTYSPLKYWPVNPADKISFFAYAPEEAKTKGYISVSAASTSNPVFTYTLPAKESDKLDLLIAGTLNCTNATNKVVLSMKHALTQVTFKAKNGDPAKISNITLTAATVTMPGTGTLTFNSASSSVPFTWTPDTSAEKQTTFTADDKLDGGKTITLGTSSEVQTLATFFLLPVGDPSTQVKFSLTYTIIKTSDPNSGNTTALTTKISPSASPLWLPGKVLGYTILIIDDRLEIDGSVTVEDFGDGTNIGGGGIPAT